MQNSLSTGMSTIDALKQLQANPNDPRAHRAALDAIAAHEAADANAAYFATRPYIDDSVKPRIRMERAVIRQFLTDVFGSESCRYLVSLHNGEDYSIRRSRDLDAIMAELMATDCEVLHVRDGDRLVGSVHLIYGNDGWDVIADYSDTEELRRLLAGAEALAERIAQEARQ